MFVSANLIKNLKLNMKRILTILLTILVMYVPVYADQVSYAYDNAGNRIKREIVIDTRSVMESTKDGKKDNQEDSFCSEMLSGKEIKIHPNPTEGDLSVEITGYEDSDKCSFLIFDMSGHQIMSARADSPVTHVDISGKPTGLYILNIILNSKPSSWKIIKK